jgi:hypothetical protein
MRLNIRFLLPAAALVAACTVDDGPRDAGDQAPDFRDGSYHYVLGYDPHTGEQIRGGDHQIVTFDEHGKREPINAANRVSRLHPDMTDNSAYMLYDGERTEGQTDWDVFASTWWPQSRNGTAWRWQPGANQDYENLSDVDRLSPMEKYDLMFYPGQPRVVPAVSHCGYRDYIDDPVNCERIDHPEVTVAGPATQWELQNQGVYQWVEPENWWGHCNGWASYAVAEPLGAPDRDIRVRVENGQVVECIDDPQAEGCMLWRMADIEALMTELYFSDQATVSGLRCNTVADEMERDEYGRPVDPACRDLNPGSFHAALVGFFNRGARHLVTGEQNARPAFIIDHDYANEVWNFPVYRYEILEDVPVTSQEANGLIGANGSSYQFNAAAQSFRRIKLAYWMISDDVPVSQLLLQADQRNVPQHRVELNYVLELGTNDRILGGEWIQDPVVAWGPNNKELHPDFMWMSIGHQGFGEDADDLGGNSDNPFISYSQARSLLLCANEPQTCAPAGGGGGGQGLLLDITAEVDRGEILDFDTGVVEPGQYIITLSHDPTRPGGDADLYVRVGAQPTTSVWDCRPYANGSAEQCTIDLTSSDTIFIQVRGWAQHINAFRLQVEGPDGGGDNGGGDAWQGLQESGSLTRNQEHRFETPVLPVGVYRFDMTGTGDADLYVRRGMAPTTAQWDCRPYLNGSSETCTVTLQNPEAIHVMVRGYANNSTYQLTGSAQ